MQTLKFLYIELAFFAVIALLMGHVSDVALAANQIAMQWMWMTVMLAYGFTEAITILVAKANGSRQYHSIIQISHSGMLLASIAMAIIACIYWIIPHFIISIDISLDDTNVELVNMAKMMLMICGIYQILDSVRIVVSGVLRGIADTKYALWSTLIAFWLFGLPISYICAFILGWNGIGIWVGLLISAISGIFMQYYRLKFFYIKVVNSLP